MSDLISRAALIAAYDATHKGPPGGARKLMKEAPAVDAVPVVRCKDCKYWYAEIGASTGWLPCNEIATDRNWYCASGKRRESE